ncbi:MAG: hypothetical protein PHC61_01010 [Chitinivibrionales bacterium]|nr:hypothetical protein [Chitinivibrionales bacterium]
MEHLRKLLVICGVFWGVGILLYIKFARHLRPKSAYAKVGKGIDDTIKDSVAALETATARLRSVFEHLKNRTS